MPANPRCNICFNLNVHGLISLVCICIRLTFWLCTALEGLLPSVESKVLNIRLKRLIVWPKIELWGQTYVIQIQLDSFFVHWDWELLGWVGPRSAQVISVYTSATQFESADGQRLMLHVVSVLNFIISSCYDHLAEYLVSRTGHSPFPWMFNFIMPITLDVELKRSPDVRSLQSFFSIKFNLWCFGLSSCYFYVGLNCRGETTGSWERGRDTEEDGFNRSREECPS